MGSGAWRRTTFAGRARGRAAVEGDRGLLLGRTFVPRAGVGSLTERRGGEKKGRVEGEGGERTAGVVPREERGGEAVETARFR